MLCLCTSWISAHAEEHCWTWIPLEGTPVQHWSQHLSEKNNSTGESLTTDMHVAGSWVLFCLDHGMTNAIGLQICSQPPHILEKSFSCVSILLIFFFAFLFKFSAPQRGLYSIYCNRITIFSEASEHRGNINNKKAFIKAYKGNFVLWFKACKMSLGKYSSKGVED